MKILTGAVFGTALMLAGSASAASDRYNISPEEHAACDGDAERFCMAAYPDEDKLISCMAINRSRLTPVCLTTFETGMKKRHLRIPAFAASIR